MTVPTPKVIENDLDIDTLSKLVAGQQALIEGLSAKLQTVADELELIKNLKPKDFPQQKTTEKELPSRRKLLRGLAASAAGLTAFGLANNPAQPKTIQAGGGIYSGTNDPNGSAIWGQNDSGNGVFGSSTTGYGIYGTSTGNGIGVRGDSSNSIGVFGVSTNNNGVQGISNASNASGAFAYNTAISGGIGVTGRCDNSTGRGVWGDSANGTGVLGTSLLGNGVQGNSNTETASGVYGLNIAAAGGYGVAGTSTNGIGVRGFSNNGLGGFFNGGMAPIQLNPSAIPGAPTSNNHLQGEVYVDSKGVFWTCTADGTANTVGTFKRLVSLATSNGNGAPATGSHEKGEIYIDAAGNFYYCTADGTPGTWHSISGSVGTTSTLTLLDVPFRLVDTFSGTNLNPGVGSLTGFGNISGGDRTNVNANTRSFTGVGGSIPANATAIAGYLYANAQAQNFTVRPGFGYLTLWKEGTLYPLATQSHGVVSLYYPHNVPTGAAFTVPVSAIGKFSVASDTTTNIIIDVTGYYS